MSLPTTLTGIVGFMLLASFLIGQVLIGENTDSEIIKLQDEIIVALNTTHGEQNSWIPFSDTWNFATTIWNITKLMAAYVQTFIGYSLSGNLPQEFYILFTICALSTIVALVKIIRGVT